MNAAQESEGLVRKQFLVSANNIKKLQSLAKARKTSAAEIVRLAIDAYEPHGAGNLDSEELMQLVSTRLKEAIESTQKANLKVTETLVQLDHLDEAI